MSRTPSVDAAVVAARLQAGETRAEIAQRLGTSYANVVAAAGRWQGLSGGNLPRVRRGRIGPVEIKHVTPRMRAVVAAYRPEGLTLRQVGAQFGKSAEWVRLQLNAYEGLTGERIARKPHGKRGPRLTIPRTPWRGSDPFRAPPQCRNRRHGRDAGIRRRTAAMGWVDESRRPRFARVKDFLYMERRFAYRQPSDLSTIIRLGAILTILNKKEPD